ncbi:MAG: hypothetical protein U9N10_00480 [Bacillota bacterium]|nr:hypothetical protein [Bacillota bacterium]
MKKNIAIIIALTLCILGVQKYIYNNNFNQLEIKIKELEDENISLSLNNQNILHELEELEKKYIELTNYTEEQKAIQTEMKYNLMKSSLPEYWHNVWDDIYSNKGILTDSQIEDINFLLQPTLSSPECTEANPLSCFFTSYYEDIKDINLDEFLRYCSYGEVPEEFPEFEDLKRHKNWPFGDANISLELPVPIHRYKKEIIQNMFTSYSGISLDKLTGTGFEDLIYIKSTDAYYNFTSDFGPGLFICTGGLVEDGIIRLNGKSRSESVLTIIKSNGKYFIESFLEK